MAALPEIDPASALQFIVNAAARGSGVMMCSVHEDTLASLLAELDAPDLHAQVLQPA